MAEHPLQGKPTTPTAIRRMVGRALLVPIASFLWALMMPGIVASVGGVFYRDGILRKIPSAAQDKLKVFDDEQTRLKAQLRVADDALTKAASDSPSAIPGLLQLRDHTERLLRASAPPISVLPFHLNPQLLLWPAIYTCLGWLTIILAPSRTVRFRTMVRSSWFWIVGSLIYVLYEWPLWMRNFVLSNEGRTVYAYPNFDVHPASFLAQELVILGFCLLLSWLWFQRIEYYSAIRKSLSEETTALPEVLAGKDGLELRDMFTQWQIASVILALGFLFFTNFFWTLVAGYRDQRYFLSAIMAHVLWALSWALLSLPVIIKWRHWSALQRRAIAEIAKDGSPIAERQFAIESVLHLRPLSSVSVSVSGVVSAISFVLPIMQLFIK